MKWNLINQSEVRVPRQFLQWWLAQLPKCLAKHGEARILKKNHLELNLVFMEAGAAAQLNRQYRLKNYATDVLSFAGDEVETLGDLVFCPDVLKQQAKEHQLSFQLELGYLIVHGVLHLLGYEHENGGKQAKHMYALQDQVFESLSRSYHLAKNKSK